MLWGLSLRLTPHLESTLNFQLQLSISGALYVKTRDLCQGYENEQNRFPTSGLSRGVVRDSEAAAATRYAALPLGRALGRACSVDIISRHSRRDGRAHGLDGAVGAQGGKWLANSHVEWPRCWSPLPALCPSGLPCLCWAERCQGLRVRGTLGSSRPGLRAS